jgi:hypothetical protein
VSVTDIGVPNPARPLTEEDPVGTDGTVTVRIIVPKGELGSPALRRIAELSEIYGNQMAKNQHERTKGYFLFPAGTMTVREPS